MLTTKKTPDKTKKLDRAIQKYVKNLERDDNPTDLSKLTYTDFFQQKMLIIKAIREGLPYSLFEKIKEISPFNTEEWAGYLGLSVKTLQRYKKENRFHFKSIHAEKIVELAEVANFGNHVFATSGKFHRWLQTPSFALNNLTPAELLKDSYGKDLVMAELNRIEYGIFV